MNPLRSLRKSYGWSQAKLGQKALIPQADICKLETGLRKPFPDEAAALSMVFRIPEETIFPDGAQNRWDGLRGQRVAAPLPPEPTPIQIGYYTVCPKCGTRAIGPTCYACAKDLAVEARA